MTMAKQRRIMEALHTKAALDPAQEVAFRVQCLKDYLISSGRNGFVLSISGGQDSALAGRFCQLAVEDLRTQTGQDYLFIALRLPYGIQLDEEDAQHALHFIAPDRVYTINIQPAVDSAVASFEKATGLSMTDYNKGAGTHDGALPLRQSVSPPGGRHRPCSRNGRWVFHEEWRWRRGPDAAERTHETTGSPLTAFSWRG